jgi:hypothetical protein
MGAGPEMTADHKRNPQWPVCNLDYAPLAEDGWRIAEAAG